MNKIKDVANLLGVKLEEEFQLCDKWGGKNQYFKITEDGLYSKPDEKWVKVKIFLLQEIILGHYDIVKLPFKPKFGEEYWTCVMNKNEDGFIPYKYVWCDRTCDYCCFYAGIVYRTREECEERADENFKKLVSDYHKGGGKE